MINLASLQKIFIRLAPKNFKSKIYFFNFKSFTDSSVRNGHTILGETMQNISIFGKYGILFPRMNHEDINNLNKRVSNKEWQQLKNHKDLVIITYDDLEFLDQNIKDGLDKIYSVHPMTDKNYPGIIKLKIKLVKNYFNQLKREAQKLT